jgi:hypothetical protein
MKKAAVGGAIVWAAPMITSMPASATVPSGCVQTDVEFGAPGTMFNAVTVAGVEITRSTVMDGGAVAQADNLTVVQNQGGLTGSFVRLNQSAIRNAGQTLTLNFSAPVTNLTFAITDIDNQTYPGDGGQLIGWSDRVSILTSGFSYTTTGGVVGTGTTGNGGGTQTPDTGGSVAASGAFRNSTSSNVPDSSGSGNLFITFAGPITSFSLRFWCGERDLFFEQINIGALSFVPCP